MTANDASRIRWYSLSDSVCAGATVMESPVWTPIGSKFSMAQMITTLSSRSRITSISYSFQPMIDSSIKTSVTGDWSSPFCTSESKSSLLYAMAEPLPPIVNDGRTTAGRPTSASASRASASVWTVKPLQTSSPIFSIAFLNWSRSSALAMTLALAAIISTPYFSSTPLASRSIATFRPVWPPRVGSSASGRSFAMTFSTICQVSGSMYVASAVAGSVMIVAGLLLTSTTS